MGKRKGKRYISYNIHGRRGRTIIAKSIKAAIRKAPKNSEKVFSESYLKKKFGKAPEYMF